MTANRTRSRSSTASVMKKIFTRMASPDGLARPVLCLAGLVLALSRSPSASREPLDLDPISRPTQPNPTEAHEGGRISAVLIGGLRALG